MGRFQLNLNHIISFYCLAKEQSFSKAAEMLAITQPAVTQHVRGLETQFGIKLVSLQKKRVHLTKAGERLMVYAEELFKQAVLTENFFKNYKSNNLSIGISSPLLPYFTSLIDHFREIYPSMKISIREGHSKGLIEELLDYKHDICLIGVIPPYSSRLQGFRIDSDEPLVFVVGPNYPLSEKPVKWKELASHPLIIQSEGSAARAIIRHEFEKKGLTPTIGMEVSNIELVKQLTRQNKGIAFMFEPNVRPEVARGELKKIRLEDEEIRMGAIDILVNREERLAPAIESFLNLIREKFDNSFHELPEA